ncbi:unnamed protein product [Prorocentrum cordatum]|uniref:Uncharacterized protein n=1 Tax=Prorocentrum cordatum TaxID=2364126 RepID=A0ABN9SZP6_9DINO|nr:unnamed protein product [Polarella glacialis]
MGKAWPAAKRGKARAASQSRPAKKKPAAAPSILKKPAAANKPSAPKNAPYVLHGTPTKKMRDAQATWTRSLHDFVNRPAKSIIDKLTRDNILPDWKGITWPYCGGGPLGPLKHYDDSNGGWAYRCNDKECKRTVLPHAFHPIFKCGAGESHASLADQASVLSCPIAKCSQTSVRLLLKKNHKLTEGIYEFLHEVRAKNVAPHEKDIKFGEDCSRWADVEADAVDLAKGEDPDAGPRAQKTVIWEQRVIGHPWRKKWVHKRNAILHTDRARTYKMKLDGVRHDWVVHARKRVKVQGKWKWVKPAYTKKIYHDVRDDDMPNKTKRIWVKAGTEIIDHVCRELRKHLGSNKIRSFQWLHWHRDE